MRSSDLGYFDFLCNIVGKKSYGYGIVLRYLHQYSFCSMVPNDDNRASDGEHLRDIFIDEVGPQGLPSLPKGPCTVFEMLIGVSFRLEFDLMGGKYEHSVSECFWILMDNLGLNFYDDHILRTRPEIRSEIDEKIENLLARTYDLDGNGGLFPLKYPQKDQRKVEIWYQMSAWVIENYPI